MDNFYTQILKDFNNSCEKDSKRIALEVRNAKIRNMVMNTIVPAAVSIVTSIVVNKLDNNKNS